MCKNVHWEISIQFFETQQLKTLEEKIFLRNSKKSEKTCKIEIFKHLKNERINFFQFFS